MVVVGAHLRAEVADRPLAYRLCERIKAWLDANTQSLNVSVLPIVCCDIWYINQQDLQQRPTISIGGPGVNALSAYYANKLPAAYVRDDQIMIQLDPEFVDLKTSIWGLNHPYTVEAIELFGRQYFDDFMKAVATQVEPYTE